MKNLLTHVLVAVKLLAQDLAPLKTPALAAVAAGALAGAAGAFGVDVSAAQIGSVLVVVGTGAGVVEKILTGQTKTV